MKIICTSDEKEVLMKSIIKSPICPFTATTDCPVEICNATECEDCVNKFIEWEIVEDGEQDG